MSQINILILDNTYTYGGAINSLKHLVHSLDRNTFNPILVSAQPEKYLTENFRDIASYHIKLNLPWENKFLKTYLTRAPNSEKYTLRFFILLIREIYLITTLYSPEALKYIKIGKKHNTQLIHLNNIFQAAGIIAAKVLGIPCIGHIRDFVPVSSSEKFYSKMVNHHVAISSAIKRNLLELEVGNSSISLVHDGIDFGEFNDDKRIDYLYDEFRIESDNLLFGIFGRVIDWKGIKEFILAANIVFKHLPKAIGFIVGDPSDGSIDYYNEMETLVNNLRLKDKLVFTGYRSDVAQLMKFMNLIVHASIRPEPFGMVIIEGMALRKPIVATRGGGPNDIVVNGETGYLVESGNTYEMAHAIIKLLGDKQLCLEMGFKGQRRAKKQFSSKVYAKKMENIYKMILNRYS